MRYSPPTVKLAKKRNDRDLVIGVEHAVVNKRILLLTLIRTHGEAALFIVGRCEIIRLGRGKAAAGALHLADMVIADIFILKLSAAIGACAHIVYYIDALVPVGRQAAQGEVAALVVLLSRLLIGSSALRIMCVSSGRAESINENINSGCALRWIESRNRFVHTA